MRAQRRARSRLAPILAACATFLALVFMAAQPARAQSAPLRVSMFGDSVMLGARDALLDQFRDVPVTVDAVEDRSLLGTTSMFQANPGALGDVVVLDLGYNDMDDPTVFRDRIDAAMSALAGVKHVIWLNQHQFEPGRAAMNTELAAAASRYPNLDVIDWNAEVNAHPEDVYGDGVHLTPAGQAAMARLVRQHFDAFVTSLTPTTTVAPPPSTPAPTGAARRTEDPSRHALREGAGGTSPDLPTEVGVAAVVFVAAIGVAAVAGRRRRTRHA